MEIKKEHLEELKEAKLLLEHPGLAAKISNTLGKPIEKGLLAVPEKMRNSMFDIVKKSLFRGVEYLSESFDGNIQKYSSPKRHRFAAAASGALGGAFGIAALAAELPVSTMIMLRSIMEIAHEHGENLNDVESRLACLEVFALGGTSKDDDAAETGYYAVRLTMAKSIAEAAKYIAERGLAEEGAPVLLRFITQIASRFGIVVSEKIAAQAVPVIGAAAGGTINTIFINHFQNMAKGHFTIRKLEKLYGREVIKKGYAEI